MQTDRCEGKLVILVGICYFCHSPSIYPISGKRSLFPSGEASFSSITFLENSLTVLFQNLKNVYII